VTNYPSHDTAVMFLLVITAVSKDPFECLDICLIRNRLVCRCVIPTTLSVKGFWTVLGCETSISLPDTDLIVLQYSNTW